MKFNLTTLAVAAALLLPTISFADDMMDPAKMTCAEFSKMDKEGMMKATEEMHKAGKDSAMAMDMAGTEKAMTMVQEQCKAKPDMMAMDAMGSM